MTLAQMTMIAAALGGLVTLWLAIDFGRDPERAMRRATHRAEKLPQVMVGRYLAFTALAFGAAVYGDAAVILYLFAVFAFISAYDMVLYRRAGHAFAPHAVAGALCLIVVALAAVMLRTR